MLEDHADAAARLRATPARRGPRPPTPSTMTRPLLGLSSPLTSRIRVDLPAPSADHAEHRTGRDREVDARERGDAGTAAGLEGLGDAFQADQRLRRGRRTVVWKISGILGTLPPRRPGGSRAPGQCRSSIRQNVAPCLLRSRRADQWDHAPNLALIGKDPSPNTRTEGIFFLHDLSNDRATRTMRDRGRPPAASPARCPGSRGRRAGRLRQQHPQEREPGDDIPPQADALKVGPTASATAQIGQASLRVWPEIG